MRWHRTREGATPTGPPGLAWVGPLYDCPVDLNAKLAILADAAKYDASCASSGTTRRNSLGGTGIGSTEGSGICHSYAPDGRCISLLKILLTNYCLYDCLPFVSVVGHHPGRALDAAALGARLRSAPVQAALF